ncbi:hypothetical protein L9F63_028349, partial [Diploptera punctata]
LLKKKRKPQEIQVSRKQFRWNLLNTDHLLNPSESNVDERAIFKLHWGVELEEEDSNHVQEMLKHVKDLQSKASSSESIKEITCKLCQVVLQSSQALRLHLQTAQHKDREEDLLR